MPAFGGLADSFNNSDPNDWSRAMFDISSIPLPLPERSMVGGSSGLPEKFSLDMDMLVSNMSLPVNDTAFIGLTNNNNINNFNNNNNNALTSSASSMNVNVIGGGNGSATQLAFPGMVRARADSRRLFGTSSPATVAGTSSSSSSSVPMAGVNCNTNNNNNNNNSFNGASDLFDYVSDIPEELLRFDLPSELTDNLQNFSIQKHGLDDADDDNDSVVDRPVRVKVEGKRTKTATRRTHTRRQPTRDDFTTDAEYEEELSLWKRNREINNESVKRSRERLNQELATKKTELKTRQAQNADIVREIEVLRSEQMLLSRFAQSPLAVQEREKGELRRILLLHLQSLEEAAVASGQEDEEDVD